MKLTRKLLASTLTLALLLSLMPLAFAAGSYSDVSNDAWYAQAVTYVTDNALMPGVSDNTFAPNDNADRATLAEALWKAAGSPDACPRAALHLFILVEEGGGHLSWSRKSFQEVCTY